MEDKVVLMVPNFMWSTMFFFLRENRAGHLVRLKELLEAEASLAAPKLN